MHISLRKIGKIAGYSATTVSNALRGMAGVQPETREKILLVASQLGYQYNPILGRIMADFRHGKRTIFKSKLALINAHRDSGAITNHPTIPIYVQGCRRRAEELGYSFDNFWLHDRSLNARSWLRIIQARGITGGIIVGLMDDSHLPAHLMPIWEKIPVVITGVRTKQPTLPFASVDHHQLALSAVEEALRLGYRRPGLVLDAVIDRLIDGRIHAGFLIGQTLLEKSDRIPAFTAISAARHDVKSFHRWLRRYKPDVLFTLYNEVFRWLEAGHFKVPESIGLIQLEWRAARPKIAGLDQCNDRVGEAAVDLLASLLRTPQSILPPPPKASLVNPEWRMGSTVRKT